MPQKAESQISRKCKDELREPLKMQNTHCLEDKGTKDEQKELDCKDNKKQRV